MLTMISLSMRIVLVLAALARPASGFFPGKSFAVSGGVAQQIEMGLASIQNLKQQSASRRHKGGSSATRTAPRMSTSSSLETSTTSDNYEVRMPKNNYAGYLTDYCGARWWVQGLISNAVAGRSACFECVFVLAMSADDVNMVRGCCCIATLLPRGPPAWPFSA